MSGGLIQLVSYSIENVFLTGDPEITMFIARFRRHTLFSMEAILQYFDQEVVKLGQKVTCTLSRAGD